MFDQSSILNTDNHVAMKETTFEENHDACCVLAEMLKNGRKNDDMLAGRPTLIKELKEKVSKPEFDDYIHSCSCRQDTAPRTLEKHPVAHCSAVSAHGNTDAEREVRWLES